LEQGGTSTEPVERVKKEADDAEADDGDSDDPDFKKEGSSDGEEEEESSDSSSKDGDEAAAEASDSKTATTSTRTSSSRTCRLLPLQRRDALPAERRLPKFERNFDRIHVVLLWNRTCSGTEREGPRALLRTVRIAM